MPSRTDHNLTRRRAASRRLPVLDCGRSDPWHYPTLSNPKHVSDLPSEWGERGYAAAAHHLIELGLTPAPNRDGLRRMWRRGGCHRRAATLVAQAWELAS